MLSRSLSHVAAALVMALLWAIALQQLAEQPVTHTGTQPTHHVNR